ncbi:MAG: alanine racemase [Limisphaerales bacterium]|jgi:alanine racemase
MSKFYRCWAEVDLEALRQNLLWIRQRVGNRVKIVTVVKADAYGHGLKQIAALLMQSGTDVFGVANLTEADAIRSVAKGWQILMLGACLPNEIKYAVCDDIMPTISSDYEVNLFTEEAKRQGKIVKVHIKVDTGMGRLGVNWENALNLIENITKTPQLKIEGVFTHFSSAEDDAEFTQIQKNRFLFIVKELVKRKIKIPFFHCNNSAGIIHEPKTIFNMVRPGLLVYGITPQGKRKIDPDIKRHLKPALSFKCRVSFIKEIPPNTPLSYGKSFISKRKMKIATITAGYGDGYMRAGSNMAQVLINGIKCNIVGKVTMDQMLVDVTQIENVKPGDEVVLIGSQKNNAIEACQVAQWFGTIPYEVFTSITYRVPRIYKGVHAS